MPKLNLNARLKGSKKAAVTSSESKFKDAVIKKVSTIAPTTYSVEYETKTVISETNIFNRYVTWKTETIKRDSFITVSHKLVYLMLEMQDIERKAVLNILNCLRFDSNIVHIDENNRNNISKSKRYAAYAINALKRYDIIKGTTEPGTFVINHNLMFLGDLNEFVRNYKAIYDDIEIQMTKDGRIII